MIFPRLETLADDVRDAFQCALPIDPAHIARQEGILLGEGRFGPSFSGRIEYHPRKGKFLLFYSSAGNHRRNRFSIAHELGHYYIEEHRQVLLAGRSHNSSSGFICDEGLEREADHFAAALLIPRRYIDEKLRKRGWMTLAGILEMADHCEASATCAAIRYAQYAEEACAVVLSQDGAVMYGITSDEMGAVGFKVIRKGTFIPKGSATARCAAACYAGIVEGQSSTTGWFANRYKELQLWEEATSLGYSGLVLTLLALDSEGADRYWAEDREHVSRFNNHQQFSLWPLPPKGGTTNGRKPGGKPFVVPALAGPKDPFRAILRLAE